MCPQARFSLPAELGGLVRTDFERVIEQANLGKENEQIARMYYIDRIPQIDVAVEMELDKATIQRRLPKILLKMRDTSKYLYS